MTNKFKFDLRSNIFKQIQQYSIVGLCVWVSLIITTMQKSKQLFLKFLEIIYNTK